ncbi:hypothetical protein PJK45_25450 [Mycobacterium kansasii]|uniref:Uncharacterized protein n=3 Tax=Mycobacterium kansasii TaxID=1768 RepID=A0A1V3WDH2_MYCKA|nr:hypothetical protein [Mycobacterium kansasii]AGZ53925.1 hypothetical protein MKAN_01405 [Mycobacterium kansasii ATCC 12478]ARG58919.1 hypothetical protein B1T43_27555 [Mycobacterium kansasii]ARG62053.1 hypothetical protein B1T45_12920 [Mycobacterium kansasii]ARG72089.1 hypothetical protein B1T47_27525 [Mycobacterium kansasii]ARG73412.1 hypothetical protein B1T51_01360 [Mycobacterium kansasii]
METIFLGIVKVQDFADLVELTGLALHEVGVVAAVLFFEDLLAECRRHLPRRRITFSQTSFQSVEHASASTARLVIGHRYSPF